MIQKDIAIAGVDLTHAEIDSNIGEALIVEVVMRNEIALMSVLLLDLEAHMMEENQLWMVIVIIG